RRGWGTHNDGGRVPRRNGRRDVAARRTVVFRSGHVGAPRVVKLRAIVGRYARLARIRRGRGMGRLARRHDRPWWEGAVPRLPGLGPTKKTRTDDTTERRVSPLAPHYDIDALWRSGMGSARWAHYERGNPSEGCAAQRDWLSTSVAIRANVERLSAMGSVRTW